MVEKVLWALDTKALSEKLGGHLCPIGLLDTTWGSGIERNLPVLCLPVIHTSQQAWPYSVWQTALPFLVKPWAAP